MEGVGLLLVCYSHIINFQGNAFKYGVALWRAHVFVSHYAAHHGDVICDMGPQI